VFNANAAVPRKRHWYTSDSAKLTLAIIISSVASFCIAVALLARSRLAPSHSLPWDSVKLLDVISIGKLGVTFKARYRGLLVSLKVTPLASAVHECQNESHSPCVLCSLPEPHPHHGAALSTLLSSAPLLSPSLGCCVSRAAAVPSTPSTRWGGEAQVGHVCCAVLQPDVPQKQPSPSTVSHQRPGSGSGATHHRSQVRAIQQARSLSPRPT
jgi:hypothetical protein